MPNEIRAALVPEERAQFDREWRVAIHKAMESMHLGDVYRMLESWRLHAILTEKYGHAGYRKWLADVERVARTGELPPGSVPWSQLKAELGL